MRSNLNLVAVLALVALSHAQVRVWEGTLSLPTYGEGAQKLPDFDEKAWRECFQSALAQALSRSESSSYTSWWDYNAGSLQNALGDRQKADLSFQKAVLLPDRMLAYHFTRLARAQAAQPAQ